MERLASTSHPARKNVGVIGLGIIGRAVAAHLRRKGFPVYVWNRSPRPVPNFVGSPAELASLCDYIQIFVSDDEALLQTVEQLSADLAPRHTVLAHSTVAPDSMRANASYSGTLALKLPKMIERDFEPQFSVKHMLKDMQIASQIALSHYLDLGVTAAARDQLLEQMQWGYADDDYSSVARKYLQEPAAAFYEEPSTVEQDEQGTSGPAITGSAESETQSVEPQDAGSQQPLLGFAAAASGAANETTGLRRGFLKQLLSRFSSGQG